MIKMGLHRSRSFGCARDIATDQMIAAAGSLNRVRRRRIVLDGKADTLWHTKGAPVNGREKTLDSV